MDNRLINDNERISLVVTLLRGTALQWFVNMKMKDQRPKSWVDFKENLRQQLLQLR